MAGALAISAPGPKPLDVLMNGMTKVAPTKDSKESKARATAQDFEAVFLNSMFQNMFTGIDGDGPFGGNGATGVWRSMLTEQYAKSFVRAGGIGIADHVYRTLAAQQEIRP